MALPDEAYRFMFSGSQEYVTNDGKRCKLCVGRVVLGDTPIPKGRKSYWQIDINHVRGNPDVFIGVLCPKTQKQYYINVDRHRCKVEGEGRAEDSLNVSISAGSTIGVLIDMLDRTMTIHQGDAQLSHEDLPCTEELVPFVSSGLGFVDDGVVVEAISGLTVPRIF
mmetsp:Transcript_37623/g.70298  ORF Transcript_37623/g.70298 Transcript_37623/m.70298 type:complete len:166 (+) Transcript_37623:132-629(+)